MKKSVLFFIAASLGLVSVSAQANITFVGDSITQGGNYLSGTVASYRYQLFKNYVDNGKTYRPMGMTKGARLNVDVSTLTPNYRGINFDNTSEAAASGRSYQYSGHAGGVGFKTDPASVWPVANRGPVTIKLGQTNTYTGTTNTYYNGSTLTTYSGATYQSLYGNDKVETLCVMIGINDLYDGRGNEAILGSVKEIVQAYQTHNPNVRVYLFELLPTGKNNGTGTNKKNNYIPYNNALRELGATWSTATSIVTVDNIATGFYAENGAMIDTVNGAHPNAQGELIVAGNIARVLGIGQRTAGLERRGNMQLASKLDFDSATTGTPTIKTTIDGVEKTFTTASTGFSVNEAGNLLINTTGGAYGYDSRLSWNTTGTAQELTVSFSVKMNKTDNEKNALGIFVGNGKGVGVIYVTECGIWWNEELLYGSSDITDTVHNTFSSTEDFIDLTVAWVDGSHGVASGFYVWLGDQLIGEAKQSITDVSTHKDKILFGDIGGKWITDCEISNISFELGSAYAPASSIPEPSSFGLLAGLGALALVGTRRRRSRK